MLPNKGTSIETPGIFIGSHAHVPSCTKSALEEFAGLRVLINGSSGHLSGIRSSNGTEPRSGALVPSTGILRARPRLPLELKRANFAWASALGTPTAPSRRIKTKNRAFLCLTGAIIPSEREGKERIFFRWECHARKSISTDSSTSWLADLTESNDSYSCNQQIAL